MTLAIWTVLYLAVGLGLAIGILFSDKFCPQYPFYLFLIIPFWPIVIFGILFGPASVSAVKFAETKKPFS